MILKRNVPILSILLLLTIISALFKSVVFDKIVLFIIVLSLFSLGRKEHDLVNPYYLFLITPLSLLIYYNVIDYYLVDLNHDTYLIAIINIFAFIVSLSFQLKNYNSKYKEVPNFSKFKNKIIVIILFLFSLIGLIVPELYTIFWLLAIPGIVMSIKSKEWPMIFISFVYILLVSSISVSKMAVLLYLLIFIISINKYYVLTGKSRALLILVISFAIGFMIFAFSFANKERGTYDAVEGLEYYGRKGHQWEYDANLFLPYMYLVSPWTNLQYVIQSQDSRTYGLWVIRPIVNYFQLDEYFKDKYRLVPYSNFNTFTFVTVGFKDFGYWLSILPTILIGFFVRSSYINYKLSLCPFDTATYIIFSLAVIQMYFSNHFYMVSYPFTMLIVMSMSKYFFYKLRIV